MLHSQLFCRGTSLGIGLYQLKLFIDVNQEKMDLCLLFKYIKLEGKKKRIQRTEVSATERA